MARPTSAPASDPLRMHRQHARLPPPSLGSSPALCRGTMYQRRAPRPSPRRPPWRSVASHCRASATSGSRSEMRLPSTPRMCGGQVKGTSDRVRSGPSEALQGEIVSTITDGWCRPAAHRGSAIRAAAWRRICAAWCDMAILSACNWLRLLATRGIASPLSNSRHGRCVWKACRALLLVSEFSETAHGTPIDRLSRWRCGQSQLACPCAA